MGSVRRANSRAYLGFLGLNVFVSAVTAWAVFSWMGQREPPPTPVPTPTIDVLARLASSLPTTTSTVAPSPTPVTYTVQPGDTLFDIAIRLGIPLDGLMAANGLTDPDALAVGQVLVVPSLEELSSGTASATPHPAPGSATPNASPQAPRVEIRGVDALGDIVHETVRLLNSGGVASMVGWKLEDGQGHIFIFPAFTLYNGAVSVHTRVGENTVIDLFWGLTDAIWESGKVITLRDSNGAVQSTFPIP